MFPLSFLSPSVFSLSFLLVFRLFSHEFLIYFLFIPDILRDSKGTLLSHPHKEGLLSFALG